MNEFENEELLDINDLEDLIVPEAVINLVLEDDTEMPCVILAQFQLPEENDIYNGYYIALIPIEDDGEEESDVLVYRYDEDEDGSMILDNIESDEEYDLVAKAYEQIMEEMQLDALED